MLSEIGASDLDSTKIRKIIDDTIKLKRNHHSIVDK